MKKNRMMRLASVLLVCVLLTTSVISGTFAKYTTSATGSDKARVAHWGFTADATIELELFENVYTMGNSPAWATNSVVSNDDADVIAPGTTGSDSFGFNFDDTAPEVAYTFEVSTAGSTCADSIKNNGNIIWSLDGVACANWDALIAAIEALDGNAYGVANCVPNSMPAGFENVGQVHTVSWEWVFETDDAANEVDTYMGNNNFTDKVELIITITATQVD